MDGISPVSSNSAVYLNPIYDIGINNPARNYLPGVKQQDTGSAAVKDGSDAADEVRLRNLKKAGLVQCETCANRKYQDVSNDPGVSFKAPGHISPQNSASAVMSHEQEHVSNEKARANGEGRSVVSQSVSLYNAVCPECGRTYVAGGTTRTVTASDNSRDYFKQQYQNSMDKFFGRSIDTRL